MNLYWSMARPVSVRRVTYIRLLLCVVIHKPVALSRVFLLSSGGKSVLLVKKKALSLSGFPLSMYVVLKTRYVNLNIPVRRY